MKWYDETDGEREGPLGTEQLLADGPLAPVNKS